MPWPSQTVSILWDFIYHLIFIYIYSLMPWPSQEVSILCLLILRDSEFFFHVAFRYVIYLLAYLALHYLFQSWNPSLITARPSPSRQQLRERERARERERGGGERGRGERERENSKTLFSKDCSLGSFRPVWQLERETQRERQRQTDRQTDSFFKLIHSPMPLQVST